MSERQTGHQIMEQRAAATIEAVNARQAEDLSDQHSEALMINQAYDMNEAVDNKAQAVADKMNTEQTREMNDAADVAVFGSRGNTEGYVGEDGNKLDAPLEGKTDEIRDDAGVDELRNRFKLDEDVVQEYAADKEKESKEYVEKVEELRGEGYELTQAKLILDLGEERKTKENDLFQKLWKLNRSRTHDASEAQTTDPNQESDGKWTSQEAMKDASERVLARTSLEGNDEKFTKMIISKEGLRTREEYDKFRYKHGKAENGERKVFTAYLDAYNASNKNQADGQSRADTQAKLDAKELAHEQVADAQRTGRGNTANDNVSVDTDTNGDGENNGNADGNGGNGAGGEIQDFEDEGNNGRSLETLAINRRRTREGDNTSRLSLRERLARRKGKIAAGLAALATAGGVGYAATHDGDHESASKGTEVARTHDNEQSSHDANQDNRHNAENGQSAETVVLEAGENPWTESEKRLRELGMKNPTNAQIEHYDRMMGGINSAYDYDGTSSEHLPVGTKLKLPR